MASQPTTLYAILNLTPQATKEEIKESYLREALLTHPDKNVENIAEANARFAQVSTVFAALQTWCECWQVLFVAAPERIQNAIWRA